DAYVMVEITDCTDENSQQSSSSSRSQPSVSLLCLLASCTTKIKVYLKSRGIDSILWILRIITIVFGVLFVISSGKEKPSYYEKTLLSAAATNALRLQQRIGRVQFNMGFIRRLFAEDASHYLLFSLTLLTVYPITFGIAPRKVPANYSVYSLPVFGYAVFFLSKPTYKKLSVTFSSSNFEDYSSIAAYILKYGALNYIH
ncbi:transmembrane protein 33, partial [Trichinella spiralis]|uniref:transmembrane protein 33 n=1 Tax=Trichinella spiralis TaxID=6334 RepID=UPI0001EFDA91